MTSPTAEPILLQREFYARGCITQALADFKSYLSATVRKDGEDTLLRLTLDPAHIAEADQIVREFLNYLLDLSLKAHLEEFRRLPSDDQGSASSSGTATR